MPSYIPLSGDYECRPGGRCPHCNAPDEDAADTGTLDYDDDPNDRFADPEDDW